MKRVIGIFLLCLALCPAPLRAESEWIAVKKIYDGDTLKLKDGRKVRLIGIDAPELHRNDKLYRDTQRTHRDAKTLLKMGKKSYEVLKKLVGKGPVRLEFDQTSRDKYQRSLAYVYVRMKPERFAKAVGAPRPKKGADDETREYLVNRELIRYGWADAFRNFDYRYKAEFLDLERQARQQGLGLWKD
ncbi:hypothetical protein FBR05_02775 [Deltaproteobacteria bacterium PRO3]|nr:hypothetical protein [Deltaproteobacteria bacterium PRO3]